MENSLTAGNLFIILAAGILPAVFWLWFWLREDRVHPEPRRYILISFLVGGLAIAPAFYLENLSTKFIEGAFLLILTWSTIEEVIKYLAAYLADFHLKAFDEPGDAMIYLITVALGFAAFENILFLLKSFYAGGLAISAVTAAMRFLGATLLHVLASASLGGFIAIAYCKKKWKRALYTFWGLISATLLHTLFNFFIIRGEGNNTLIIFAFLWLGIIILLLFFERVKKIVCEIRPELKHRL